ncbi:xylan 1,4-beta-xylosidase [Actinoplanes cyaneus]|uniref:Xylan 1,4-beta-xylosidase n=1 Tax=Actinoplanes cyaneus TaxID=52696 RepID=A0A919MAA0_9ACTN|nr:family 43 glycosylhydrolase [Actinoplanes cyaneus]MCW2141561.1 xylan 1,4-beta-xylosidase [Actinoplanes cyaneus]GID68359.1 xylan 1,4-beta-xylosidase [Actinoplanes cyaneus]
MLIRNPILPGFHPDPAILRVGDDYYIATSTFEWHPGVQIHHSRDLAHWRPLGGALDTQELLDLRGVPDSGGVWAPDLTYANGRFHLVFGVVDAYAFGHKDVTVMLTSAPRIDGPWERPVVVPSRGFDPSLFHDADGTTWLVNMAIDRTPGSRGFAGVQVQRLDGTTPVGDPHWIHGLTEHGVTEGPHLYRIGDWYYLLVAEGGTGWRHGALVLRSRELLGHYEPDPAGPLITSRDDPGLALQKAGHASLVATPDGQWFAAHLAARPYGELGPCVLGRETALQQVTWVNGWPRIAGARPAVEVSSPLAAHPWPDQEQPWSGLRRAVAADWVEFGDPIRIRGGQSAYGRRAPSLLARPISSRTETFAADVTFTTDSPHQSAGITAFYNSRNWYYLALTADGFALTGCDHGRREVLFHGTGSPRRLELAFDGPVLRFAADGTDLGVTADATVLSDEHAVEHLGDQVFALGFTGAMVGLWVQDLAHEGCHADFAVAT